MNEVLLCDQVRGAAEAIQEDLEDILELADEAADQMESVLADLREAGQIVRRAWRGIDY